jgi:hypothetical protein
MEAISSRKTIEEIAADHAIQPIELSQRKRQPLDGASEMFTRGKKSMDKEKGQAKEAEMFQQIGKLEMELEWLKKILSCSNTRDLRKLVDHDNPEISISRQCALLGLPDPRCITGPRRCGHRHYGSWPGLGFPRNGGQ